MWLRLEALETLGGGVYARVLSWKGHIAQLVGPWKRIRGWHPPDVGLRLDALETVRDTNTVPRHATNDSWKPGLGQCAGFLNTYERQ